MGRGDVEYLLTKDIATTVLYSICYKNSSRTV